MKRSWRSVVLALTALVGAVAVWSFLPGPNRFRSFDPSAVASAETEMWRAYYEGRRLSLFSGLMLNAHRDFGLSPYDSARAGLAAAEAARTFQRSRSRAEAQNALPALTRYFDVLARATRSDFDPAQAARLELEWWQLRREVDGHDGYAPAIAAAAAYTYGVDPADLDEYARLRAQAMDLRDRKGRAIADEDWRQVDALLEHGYEALRREVSQPPPRRASAAR